MFIEVLPRELVSKEHRVRVLLNEVLRTIFGPDREEVIGGQ
jgi:hypothetical protein